VPEKQWYGRGRECFSLFAFSLTAVHSHGPNEKEDWSKRTEIPSAKNFTDL